LDTPFFNYLAKLRHLTTTLHVQNPRQIPPTRSRHFFAINCKQRSRLAALSSAVETSPEAIPL
jgi:hypothetical protein